MEIIKIDNINDILNPDTVFEYNSKSHKGNGFNFMSYDL